jgi:hypothetical protein
VQSRQPFSDFYLQCGFRARFDRKKGMTCWRSVAATKLAPREDATIDAIPWLAPSSMTRRPWMSEGFFMRKLERTKLAGHMKNSPPSVASLGFSSRRMHCPEGSGSSLLHNLRAGSNAPKEDKESMPDSTVIGALPKGWIMLEPSLVGLFCFGAIIFDIMFLYQFCWRYISN